ncbi:hypothetical protein D3C77_627230 [compost metagenome]
MLLYRRVRSANSPSDRLRSSGVKTAIRLIARSTAATPPAAASASATDSVAALRGMAGPGGDGQGVANGDKQGKGELHIPSFRTTGAAIVGTASRSAGIRA